MYYELTNCKIVMLNQQVQVNKVTSNCTLYKAQTKLILNTNFSCPNTKILINILTNQTFVAALISMHICP